MKVRDPRLEYVYGEGRRLSFLVEDVKDAERVCDEMQGVLDLEIKKHREKRSLTANAYAWKLMSKIGKAVTPPIPNEEVYEMMLRQYAPVQIVFVPKEVDLKEYVPHCEEWAESADMVYWKVYKGSSEYDSKEMSVFIEGIKAEAEQLGIETLPPDELRRLYAQVDALHGNSESR